MKAVSQDLLDEVTRRLVAEFQPEQIWLFGSYAWGTPHEDSDVDLMVVVPQSEERPARRMQRALRCLRGLGVSKDVLVQTRAEFERYQGVVSALAHKIIHQGRKLYG